jgi:hypothetical protein
MAGSGRKWHPPVQKADFRDTFVRRAKRSKVVSLCSRMISSRGGLGRRGKGERKYGVVCR